MYGAIGHPVGWIGALIARLDGWLNVGGVSASARRSGGVTALVIVLAAAGGAASLFEHLAGHGAFGFIVLALAGSSLIAQRSLYDHVADVARALETEGLKGGRDKVARIVGRDVAALDEAGVARAAVESLAENFSDGVVAPVFWTAAFGLAGGAAYKAVNTADSMIGHKNAKYLLFGEAAARFDDLVNLPASRLAALWLTVAAKFSDGADWRGAKKAVLRDASQHRSPNAGWPEAAMAGALGFRLAGPRAYDGVKVDDVYMGDGRAALTATDIWRALDLYRKACLVQAVALLVCLVVVR